MEIMKFLDGHLYLLFASAIRKSLFQGAIGFVDKESHVTCGWVGTWEQIIYGIKASFDQKIII